MLNLRAVTKRFGNFTALDGFDFEVRAGEITALLGENGAGKSTTIGLIGGELKPDGGEILWEGEPTSWGSPRLAARAGIGVVHQHFALVPAFTVAENLALHSPGAGKIYSKKVWEEKAVEWARQLGWSIDPRQRVSELSVGEQQRVEIIKAVFSAGETKLLLLDEPTANLTPQEADELFVVLRQLKERGLALVFVSHKLREVMELCDRAVVLRRGKLAGERKIGETDVQDLAELMVGAQSEALVGEKTVRESSQNSKTLLKLEGAVVAGLKPISLELRSGEILGLAGVDGNGQRELFEVIAGLRTVKGAAFEKPVGDGAIAFVPPDRRSEGLILSFDIAENLALGPEFRREFVKAGRLNWRRMREKARSVMEEFDVRSPVTDGRSSADRTQTGRLSGGNAQKVVLARALTSKPQVVVAVDPTRGLDVGAAAFVHGQLRQAAAAGAGVLLISTDLDEVLGLSHRIGALFDGRVLPEGGQFLEAGASREEVGRLMGGASG